MFNDLIAWFRHRNCCLKSRNRPHRSFSESSRSQTTVWGSEDEGPGQGHGVKYEGESNGYGWNDRTIRFAEKTEILVDRERKNPHRENSETVVDCGRKIRDFARKRTTDDGCATTDLRSEKI